MSKPETPLPPHAAAAKRKLLREISQEQMRDFETHLRDLRTLKAELKAKAEIVEALESAFDKMLTSGYAQEAGDLRLTVDVTARATAVKWKEEFARVAGPKEVERVMKDAGVTEYRHVNVASALRDAAVKEYIKERKKP